MESMNAQSSMAHNARTMQTKRIKWKNINWIIAESYVNRLQVRIVKAVQKDKWRLVKRLQKLITNSFYAKAIAVKRVITNKGKHTPGIDKVVWETDEDKSKAVEKLDTSKYQPPPIISSYIQKYAKKQTRPLGIPTMQDRAMQGLMWLALEPVAETTADRVSLGFRRNRSAQDAMEYIFKLLARKTSPQWILEGDIKGCFDHISHEWMLGNIPTDKRIMRQFLKCGYVDGRTLFPTEEGSPQGGLISSTYANLTLDGMEELLLKKYSASSTGYIHPKPEVSLPTPNEVFIDEAVKKKLSEIIDEINAAYNKNFDVDVASKSALQMRDILLKNGHLRDSARNNSLKDFRFAYFDAVQDALIAGYEQNQDFFALLLDNDEKKRELMQVFLEDVYKNLRG